MAARREQGVWVNDSDERATIVVNTDGSAVGSGTEYTEGGATDSTPTGSAVIWFNGSDEPLAVKPDQALPTTRYSAAGTEVGTTSNPDVVQGPAAAAALATGNPVPVGGTDGTNRREWKMETSGAGHVWLASSLNASDDRVSVVHDTAAIGNAGTLLTPKFVIIDAASSGDNTILAAVASKKIRVLSYTLVASGAVTCRFESGAGGTALTGQMQFAANGGVSVAYSPVGHFETASNTLLNLELSGATSVDGHLCYVEV